MEKMHKATGAVAYFATNEWKWSNDNVDNLYMELTDVDKKTFNFDLSTLNWTDYIADWVKVSILSFSILTSPNVTSARVLGSMSSKRTWPPWTRQGNIATTCSGWRNVFR